MKFANDILTSGEIFYGMHFEPGTAEYREKDGEPYRVMINEVTAKQMDPSFAGKPVYVDHANDIDLKEADGFVYDSFYNELDGKHWVRFVVVTERGLNAIRNGWKLSNAYVPDSFGPGGLHHGVEYSKEVVSGKYEHLAIVQRPRYEASRILTPAQFKAYNEAKEAEIKKLKTNSKGEETVFDIFKKAKVENAQDFDSLMVKLPKSGKEFSFAALVNAMDKIENMHGYASDDHMVKVSDSEEMPVKELRDCYGKMKSELEDLKAPKKENEVTGEDKTIAKEDKEAAAKEKADEGKKKNEEEEKKKKENEEKAEKEKAAEEKKQNDLRFEKLKNDMQRENRQSPPISLGMDGAARGKARYGSK